ncbi:MAG: RdgB/HAM1 family non-canonical purine NTP pyrophosphatase [Rhodospirillales bacterium]|nr:RdgB/HAM1 family non-canonical purine NTP pyrophosphatase [Rhodospirillales bacterium]
MTRRFSGSTLVIASHNEGKVAEFGVLLAPYGVQLRSAAELGLPEPEETGDSFSANAELKARAAAESSGCPALADDSGLVVTALDGAPGIHSARWGGESRDFAFAMSRVQDALADETDRSAHFIAALCLCWPGGHCETVVGRVDGTLVWPARGSWGFGYDPMFVPTGHNLTFGEMEPEAKEAISHRADAFAKLVKNCFDAK